MKQFSRNEICYCGSGKKYKNCCINNDFKILKPIIKRSKDFIIGMALTNRLARKTLIHTANFLKPGITTKELELIAHNYMLKHNAIPATLNYHGYPSSICTSINEVICHGIPENRKLVATDIINLDVSCILNGYFGDVSATYGLGKESTSAKKLIFTTAKCLDYAIGTIKPYAHLGDIGYAIEQVAGLAGFSVVDKFVGHGIGTSFHEEPQVPHFGRRNTGHLILPGMVFTVEPMINEGVKDSIILEDGWTAITKDNKLSAQFEHTILITKRGFRVLTNEMDDLALIPSEDLAEYD